MAKRMAETVKIAIRMIRMGEFESAFLPLKSRAVMPERMAVDMKNAPMKSMRLSLVRMLWLGSRVCWGSLSFQPTRRMERRRRGHWHRKALLLVSSRNCLRDVD